MASVSWWFWVRGLRIPLVSYHRVPHIVAVVVVDSAEGGGWRCCCGVGAGSVGAVDAGGAAEYEDWVLLLLKGAAMQR